MACTRTPPPTHTSSVSLRPRPPSRSRRRCFTTRCSRSTTWTITWRLRATCRRASCLRPRLRVPGYDLHAMNVPTMAIGGDYFDYLPLDDGRLGLVVADVSGKGVAAALIMATFRAALRAEVRRSGSVSDPVDQVNTLLLDSIDPSRYVTAVYGILDPSSGRLRLRELRAQPADAASGRRRLHAAGSRPSGARHAGRRPATRRERSARRRRHPRDLHRRRGRTVCAERGRVWGDAARGAAPA